MTMLNGVIGIVNVNKRLMLQGFGLILVCWDIVEDLRSWVTESMMSLRRYRNIRAYYYQSFFYIPIATRHDSSPHFSYKTAEPTNRERKI